MTGDRNVPAGKVTLFTLDEAPTLGHYTGTELVDEGDTQPRPVGARCPLCTEFPLLGVTASGPRQRCRRQIGPAAASPATGWENDAGFPLDMLRASLCCARPAVAFQESGMEYINLGEREVLARYRANGQMSYIPGIWDPVWSRGQVGHPRVYVQRARCHGLCAQSPKSCSCLHPHALAR